MSIEAKAPVIGDSAITRDKIFGDNAEIINHRENYFYNTSKGLEKWRASLSKLKADGSENPVIQVVGDSIFEGVGSTDYDNKSVHGFLRTKFASEYNDVGFGLVPIYYRYNNPLWSFSGGWTNYSWGLYGNCKGSDRASDTATVTLNGDTAKILMITGATQTVSIVVDGGAPIEINTATGSLETREFEFSLGANGVHNVVINPKGDGLVIIAGVSSFVSSSGVVVNMASKASQTANSASSSVERIDACINYAKPNLTIIGFMANDIAQGFSKEDYLVNMQKLITAGKQHGSVLIVTTGLSSTYSDIATQTEYATAIFELALSNNCAVFDLFNYWGADPSNVEVLGYYSDGIHPNIYGYADIILNNIYKVLS